MIVVIPGDRIYIYIYIISPTNTLCYEKNETFFYIRKYGVDGDAQKQCFQKVKYWMRIKRKTIVIQEVQRRRLGLLPIGCRFIR
jgi:hypothetical protein